MSLSVDTIPIYKRQMSHKRKIQQNHISFKRSLKHL